MRKVIFLDIDGVLNQGIHSETQRLIDPACMERLNAIIERTNSEVVVSSSWRYMVYGGAMRIDGFSYLFRTHGLCKKLMDITPRDEEEETRGDQISLWLRRNPGVEKYVVIDNMDLDISSAHPFVHVDGSKGLTDLDVETCLRLLF